MAERRLKRALIRTKGEFKLCLIDAENITEELRSSFNIHYTPSIFLFYKESITHEHRGNPTREKVVDFVRAAQFFYQVSNEEKLILQLIKEGDKCIKEKKYTEAIDLYKKADTFERWKELYGGNIYASLAFCFAQLGNKTQARHFVSLFDEAYGDYGIQSGEDQNLINQASQLSTEVVMTPEPSQAENESILKAILPDHMASPTQSE